MNQKNSITVNHLNNSGIKYSPSMKEHVSAHQEQLEAILRPLCNHATINMSLKANNKMKRFNINVMVNGTLVEASSENVDFYDAVDNAFDKMKNNLRKYKAKHMKAKNKHDEDFNLDEIEKDITQILREKTIDCIAMSRDAAIMQLEELNHDFFLFLDKISLLPCVIYRREDGFYGILKLKTLGN